MTQTIDQTPPAWPPPAASVLPPTAAPGWRSAAMPLILAGIGAMVVGLFSPWVSAIAPFVGQISRSGLDTSDGKMIGVAVIVLAVLALVEMGAPSVAIRAIMIVVAVGIGVVMFADYHQLVGLVADINSGAYTSASVGYGTYLMGGGVVLVAGGAIQRMSLLRLVR